MSIIVVFKEADTLILSSDSRMMAHDYSGVDCDTQQKIFQIGPGAFIATSGRLLASEFQIARARVLAVELGTDIQEIGAALERESLPCLMTLLERLRSEKDETTMQAVAGNIMFHGSMLVGQTGGKLGYVQHTYWVQADGTIKCTVEAYFDAPRKVACIAGTPARLMTEIASRFMYDMATWTDPLEEVSMRFLEAVKRETPTIGGPWQVVRLDAGGAHWISQPAADHASETAAGTCTATVSFTSPVITGGSIAITTSGGDVRINSGTSGMQVSSNGGNYLAHVGSTVVSVQDTSSGTKSASLSPTGLVITGPSGNAAIAPTGLLIGVLPISSPGSKQFWYDPADGNRVKYTP